MTKHQDQNPPDELAARRREIDAIDRQLIELLDRRKQEVEKVVAYKKEHGLPIYHPKREEDLLTDRRKQAGAMGLDPDMVEEVFRTMIRSSRVSQGREMASHAVRPGTRIVIVGGRGAMGKLLHQWFSEAGYDVAILEKEDWVEADEICRDAELAILSVPIDKTEAVARFLAPHLPPDCILADIASVKERPLQAMLESHPGPVIALHPMFGPTTHTMDKQLVVVCGGRMLEKSEWLLKQFKTWGAVVESADAKEHDEIMAVVQALRHFATFAFGQFLWRRQINIDRSLLFSSPIYRLELGMVGRLFAQDPHLYAEIIFATPERLAILKDYIVSLQQNLSMIVNGDKDEFCEEFNRIAECFGPFTDQAIRESSFLIDKLVERF